MVTKIGHNVRKWGMCPESMFLMIKNVQFFFTDLESPYPIWHQWTYIIQSEHDTSIELHVPFYDATNYVV